MKNNWDLLNTDCKNYIIEWKNKLNYFHTGFYYFNDLIFGKIYIFIIEITMFHVIILDLNVFKSRKKKKMYDFSGDQYIKFMHDKHKIFIYPHYLNLLQYF
jgi:hypothetical protein